MADNNNTSSQNMMGRLLKAAIDTNNLASKVTADNTFLEYQGIKEEDMKKFCNSDDFKSYFMCAIIVNQVSNKKKNKSRLVVKGESGKTVETCMKSMANIENDYFKSYLDQRNSDGRTLSIRGAICSKIIDIVRDRLMKIYKSVFENIPVVSNAFNHEISIFYLRWKNAMIGNAEIDIFIGQWNRLKEGTAYNLMPIPLTVLQYLIRRSLRAIANYHIRSSAEWSPNDQTVVIVNDIISWLKDAKFSSTSSPLNTDQDKRTVERIRKSPIGSKFSYD